MSDQVAALPKPPSFPPGPVKVTIGKETFELPEVMNFETMERVWPSIDALATGATYTARTSAILGVVAAIMVPTRPELNIVTLKKTLATNPNQPLGDQRDALFAAVNEILFRSGIFRRGEDQPPAPGSDLVTAGTGSAAASQTSSS